jgi:hypothetical protein
MTVLGMRTLTRIVFATAGQILITIGIVMFLDHSEKSGIIITLIGTISTAFYVNYSRKGI